MIFSPEDFRITKKVLKGPGEANAPVFSQAVLHDGIFSKALF